MKERAPHRRPGWLKMSRIIGTWALCLKEEGEQ